MSVYARCLLMFIPSRVPGRRAFFHVRSLILYLLIPKHDDIEVFLESLLFKCISIIKITQWKSYKIGLW